MLGLHVPEIQSLSSKTRLKWNTAKYTKIQLTGKGIWTIKDTKVLVWNWWKTSWIIYKAGSRSRISALQKLLTYKLNDVYSHQYASSSEVSAECRQPINRHVGRQSDNHSWSTYRPTHLGRHIDRHSADMSTDMSVEGCTKDTWSPKIAVTWILARVFTYLPSFYFQILDLIYWTVFIFYFDLFLGMAWHWKPPIEHHTDERKMVQLYYLVPA